MITTSYMYFILPGLSDEVLLVALVPAHCVAAHSIVFMLVKFGHAGDAGVALVDIPAMGPAVSSRINEGREGLWMLGCWHHGRSGSHQVSVG